MSGAPLSTSERFRIGLARSRLQLIGSFPALFGSRLIPEMPCSVMGLTIPNPVGLAAGLDKTGRVVSAAGVAGFGFVEVGSVTPANLDETIINLQRRGLPRKGQVIGVNVGCLPGAEGCSATGNYLAATESCLPLADYLVLNLSSPLFGKAWASGTSGLQTLLSESLAKRDLHREQTGRHVPLAIKVPMAGSDERHIPAALAMARELGFDGSIVATPSRLSESAILDTLKTAKSVVGNMSLISVGGVRSASQVSKRLGSGAAAVQVFSGVIRHGPFIARRIVSELMSSPVPAEALEMPS